MKPLCIYHGNCPDGFGAAWCVKYFVETAGRYDFHFGDYRKPPPDVTGRDVLMVDFSYKRAVVEDMIAKANSVTWIDHHMSAIQDLAPLVERGAIKSFTDTSKSGAALTWEYFAGSRRNMPRLLAHIEDRDLWRFALQNTREIQASVASFPYDFAVWTDLMLYTDLDTLASEGRGIVRKEAKDRAELLSASGAMHMSIAGYVVPAVNLPYTMASEACTVLAANAPFAVSYWDTIDGRSFSLRSAPDGVNVAEIAARFGGGGHDHASGFSIPRNGSTPAILHVDPTTLKP